MNCPLCTQPMQHAAAAPHLVWYRCPDCRVQVSEAARTFARLLAPLNFKRDRT